MEQSPAQFLTSEESAQVESALLSSSEKFLTRLTISSYRLLQIMAEDMGISVNELTSNQIIEWMEQDSKIKREEGIEASVLKW